MANITSSIGIACHGTCSYTNSVTFFFCNAFLVSASEVSFLVSTALGPVLTKMVVNKYSRKLSRNFVKNRSEHTYYYRKRSANDTQLLRTKGNVNSAHLYRFEVSCIEMLRHCIMTRYACNCYLFHYCLYFNVSWPHSFTWVLRFKFSTPCRV